MQISLLLRTLPHLKTQQIVFQILRRLHKPALRAHAAPRECGVEMVAPIAKYRCLEEDTSKQPFSSFNFLNIAATLTSWNDTTHGMLWAYNLNYMDWLGQPQIRTESGERYILKFIEELPHNTIGLDPYPIALRGINWIKFLAAHHKDMDDEAVKKINDSLYAQYCLLTRKLEYHLLGNHLLEDAFSLFCAAIYFRDIKMWRKAYPLLQRELNEQILPDGAHYEQSPMYHCILLDRLLDCLNICQTNTSFPHQDETTTFLRHKAAQMLGHLDSICYADGTYPLFNDAAEGIAPTPGQLKDYAHRLSLTWKPLPLADCGYRHFLTTRLEAFVDGGGITATYQPGHTHSDALSYELRIDGHPFIVDTGISTYNKTQRRQHERSTAAHNTVSIGGNESTEVWGGFRVARRPRVSILTETSDALTAEVSSRRTIHRRTFKVTEEDTKPNTAETLHITDDAKGGTAAISRIHLAPGIRIISTTPNEILTSAARITLNGADKIEIQEDKASTAYNHFQAIQVICLHFTSHLEYTIHA